MRSMLKQTTLKLGVPETGSVSTLASLVLVWMV